ncbi:MAG: YtcP3 [Paenibacillaceae bacterium]|jgi:putative aldouronate transport system permease protein|nr:YtcP3 [Paenibacillaceae bacterium]
MRETRGEKIFNGFNIALMIFLCALMIYPMLFVLGRSFMLEVERAANPLRIFPRIWDLEAYKFIFREAVTIKSSYFITISRTVVGTACNILFTSVLAYVLSKRSYPLRNMITTLVLFTMWFGGGLIPTFLLYKSLGLVNNFWVYILPGLISPWNLLLLRNFFMQIPDSLEEAAKIDGASELTIFFRIIIPLSMAAIATISLFYAVSHWNSWFDSLIFINDKKMWTLQLLLREIIRNANMSDLMDTDSITSLPPTESVKMATVVVATLPILMVYPFLQKYFVKGVMVGSLKG